MLIAKSFVVFLLLSASVLAADTSKSKSNQIIDANHFYSEENKLVTYDITELNTGRPLVLVLMPSENDVDQNTKTLTFKIGSQTKQCKFTRNTDVCVLENVEKASGKLDIQCQKLPCDVKWKIYQNQIKELEDTDKVEKLYKLPANTNRVSVSLKCESAKQKTDKQDMIAIPFSNIEFRTFPTNSDMLNLIFPEVKSGYLFFVINPKKANCLKMRVNKGAKALQDKSVKDFIMVNQTVSYDIDFPDNKNFVIEMSFHPIFSQKIEKQIFVSITGEKDGNKKVIRKNKVEFNPSYPYFGFSYGVPGISKGEYKNVKLELESDNTILTTELLYKKTEVFEVEATQFNYFNLKKGQKLKYHLIEQKNAQQKDIVMITPSQKDALKISKQSCNVKTGCEFDVQALKDIEGNIYLGVGTGKTKQVVVLDFGKSLSFTHRIKQQGEIYIKKKLQLKKAVQVIINTPNVIVYMSSASKCPIPSRECNQKMGNINKHFFYVPETQDQTDVVFKIEALDDCEFTLSLLPEDTEYVNLVDSQPFVYMFSPDEKFLKLRFTRSEKVDVNFNLIAPLHALDLIVENGKKLPDDESATISVQGYLEFKAKDAPKNEFSILVRRRQSDQNSKKGKYIHFTLIASTKGKHIRLQSGVTHYETLTKSGSNNAEYMFEFDPDEDYFLNFYSHNTKEEDIKIKLSLRAITKQANKKVENLTIDRSSDALDLSQVSKQLCAQVDEDSNCQIAFVLQNQMDIEVDIAITLMEQHSILQLKDGLWQSFALNSVAKTTHFYFTPKNKKDVEIMFKSTDAAIRLKYRLFYTGEDQINPASWPFPNQQISAQQAKLQVKHKAVNHFSISKSRLSQCWPDCTVLISIIDLQKKTQQGSFSLLASNSILQIPEKQKIDITLAADESKSYLIDLKYALDIEQNLYFYIYHSIGLTSIYANVYSEKNDRVPDSQAFDFALNSEKENTISISSIKDIMKSQQMDEHINIYLYIVVESMTDSKVSIEFAFKEIDEPNQKLLSMDSFQHVMLNAKEAKIFYAPIYQPYEVKLVREKGFPSYQSLVCKKNLDDCLVQIRESTQKGSQLLTKVAAYTASPCESCFYIFKISAQTDPSQVTIHLQSKSSEIELIENKAVYDFTEKKQANRYMFYAIRGEQIYVNVHITEGEVEVQITDMGTISQTKSGKNIVSFIIPAQSTTIRNKKDDNKKLSKQSKQQIEKQQAALTSLNAVKEKNPILSQAIMTAFGLSDKFVEFRVSVKSTDQKPSIYTISYSSGQRQFELQDGLITDYVLEPKKQVTFYYSAVEAYHMYLIISMEKSSYLKDLKIALKYCQPKNHIIDDDCWVDYKTDSPTVKDKVPHPTLVYLLMNRNYIAITLSYNGDHSEKVSLGINHQQIMILPFDVQFPFILHQNENIDFLVELSNPGYVEITVRKCDESNPTFSYTFDYEAFQKGEYTYESELGGASPKSRFMSKVKPGTLYMQMKTPPTQSSIVSVMVHYSEKKIFDPEILAGNKGNVDYTVVDSTNAEMTIRPPTCPDAKCPKFKYYIMSALKMRDLYTQLVCPSNFFTNTQLIVGEEVKLKQVTPRENSDGTLSIALSLMDQISYVGIKASNGNKQVFYKPLEVATFWGQLSRTSHSHKLTIASLFICIIVGIVVCVRRSARKGYKPIDDQI